MIARPPIFSTPKAEIPNFLRRAGALAGGRGKDPSRRFTVTKVRRDLEWAWSGAGLLAGAKDRIKFLIKGINGVADSAAASKPKPSRRNPRQKKMAAVKNASHRALLTQRAARACCLGRIRILCGTERRSGRGIRFAHIREVKQQLPAVK